MVFFAKIRPESMSRYTCLRLYLYLAGIALVASVISTPASADEGDEQQAAALGVGGESCSVYMTTYEHNPNSVDDDHEIGDEGVHHEAAYTSSDYIHWLQGYLSAYNQYENDGKEVSARASAGGMLYFLYRRCSETPEAAFHTMMPALLERLNLRSE